MTWPRLRTLSFQLLFGLCIVWAKPLPTYCEQKAEVRAEAKAALHICASDIAAWQKPSFVCGWFSSSQGLQDIALLAWLHSGFSFLHRSTSTPLHLSTSPPLHL